MSNKKHFETEKTVLKQEVAVRYTSFRKLIFDTVGIIEDIPFSIANETLALTVI